MSAPTTCYVYVIAADMAVGPVKVGIAANPEQRRRDLQTGHYRKLTLAGTHRLPDREWASHIEQCFHDTQAKKRVRGEWFDMCPGAAWIILKIAIGTIVNIETSLTPAQIDEGLALNGWCHEDLLKRSAA